MRSRYVSHHYAKRSWSGMVRPALTILTIAALLYGTAIGLQRWADTLPDPARIVSAQGTLPPAPPINGHTTNSMAIPTSMGPSAIIHPKRVREARDLRVLDFPIYWEGGNL